MKALCAQLLPSRDRVIYARSVMSDDLLLRQSLDAVAALYDEVISMDNICLECGAPVPTGGACLGHFHALSKPSHRRSL